MRVTRQGYGYTLLVTLLLLALLAGCSLWQPEDPEERAVERIGILGTQGDTFVTGWNGSSIALYSDAGATAKFTVAGATGNTAVGGTLTVTGASTFTGDTTVGGALDVSGLATLADLQVSNGVTIAAQTALTVTNGDAFTVTGTYQPIVAAEAVTPTLTGGDAGQIVVLTNVGTDVITIADDGTTMLSADWAGGQYDTLTLISDGTNWLELARSNN
jgi:fibronectin-binding autotransporter adhesin